MDRVQYLLLGFHLGSFEVMRDGYAIFVTSKNLYLFVCMFFSLLMEIMFDSFVFVIKSMAAKMGSYYRDFLHTHCTLVWV